MVGYLRAGLAFCGMVVAVVAFAGDALAATIKTQPPCGSGEASCGSFSSNTAQQFDIRTFTFKAPSKGAAEVTFHGSLICANETSNQKTVALVTQIVNAAAATASPGEPGGLRHALLLQPIVYASDTLNLTSTRVVSFGAAGSQTFRYRVRVVFMDPGITCDIYNAAFSVVFVP